MYVHKPKITVIIICYNQVQYLRDAINSVLNQTYNNIQIIVADDNSTDGSAELLNELSIKHNFIFLSSKINMGLNNNILRTLSSVQGEYVSILASDDYIALNKIELQVEYLLSSGDDGVYATGYAKLGESENLIILNKVFAENDKKKILDYVYSYDYGAPLLQSGLFKKSLVLDLVQLWKNYKSDDWSFLIKSFEQYNIGFINQPLFYYRLHNTNTHKNYWATLPMRVDIASRLVPPEYRVRTLSNILLSHGHYLLADKIFFTALKFYFSSLIMNFSFKNLLGIIKNLLALLKNSFNPRK